jgi:hypothetical protein
LRPALEITKLQKERQNIIRVLATRYAYLEPAASEGVSTITGLICNHSSLLAKTQAKENMYYIYSNQLPFF